MSQERYFIDNKTIICNTMGDVENVNPRTYFMDFHYQSIHSVLVESLAKKGIQQVGTIPDMINKFSKNIVSEQFIHAENLGLPKSLKILLTKDLSKKEQILILKGVSISNEQLATLYLFASDNGYLMTQYISKKDLRKYEMAQLPSLIYINEEGEVQHSCTTKLTDGQLKEIIENSSFTLARIFTKGNHWHCFYQRKNGIAGKEPGQYGSQSHFHYISDSFGIRLDDLKKSFKQGICPHSKVHLLLKD
jgi:hypothetical protein